ncbi:hypothetical protein MMC29_007018, partial [Sticta canariensis]|nr:hypothetical protein [Sticta canariensis]
MDVGKDEFLINMKEETAMVKPMDDLEESSGDKLSVPTFSMEMPIDAVQDAATCSTEKLTGYRR